MRPPPSPTAVALARLYDVDLLEDPGDLDLVLALAERADGRILELGVGSGRLAVPLAVAGWPVTGVDNDPAMLRRARARADAAGATVAGRLELVEANAAELRSPARYRLGFIALNSLLVFGDRTAQAAAVATLAHHLEPGGLCLIDLWLPDADDLVRYDGRIFLEYVRVDPETGRTVTKTGSALHDGASQTVHLTTIYDEGAQGESPLRWSRTDRIRLVGAEELVLFAEAAGLEVELLARDYDLEPMGPGADRAILVAMRP